MVLTGIRVYLIESKEEVRLFKLKNNVLYTNPLPNLLNIRHKTMSPHKNSIALHF